MQEKTSNTKKQIAVLGAGLSGLSAAFELTDYPGWNELYDVTVYQFGWQLGGKCRTGRGPRERIEEHGIHVFLGFYNNAMRMVRLAYDEVKKSGGIPPDSPFRESWESLFYRDYSIQLPVYSKKKDTWEHSGMVFPGNDLVPGVGEAPSEHENMKKMLLLALEFLLGSPYGTKGGCLGRLGTRIMNWIWPADKNLVDYVTRYKKEPHEYPTWWKDLHEEVRKTHGHTGHPIEKQYLLHIKNLVEGLPNNHEEAARMHAEAGEGPHAHEKMVHLMFGFISIVEKLIGPLVHKDSKLNLFWLFVQLGYYNFLGLNEIYDQKTGTYNFNSINDVDYRTWLKKLGAPHDVVWSAPVKDIYALVFAYPSGGDTSRPGSIAAGTALLGAMLILLGYKGAVMYRFNGGTADVVISHVYEALKARGVKFKFFHEVEKIDYSDGNEIESITVGEQIRLKNPNVEFQPTKRIKHLNAWCSHPFWRWQELADQINPDDLAELQKNNTNLNSAWSGWKNRNVKVLKKGVDFDDVVLAISVAGLRTICSDIISNPKRKDWHDMVNNVATVQTQGVQLWMNKTLKELGMDFDAMGLRETNLPIFDTYANPINSYADMSNLIPCEEWTGLANPKSIAYFCGPLAETGPIPPFSDTEFPDRQNTRVKEMTMQWLFDNANFIWPLASTDEDPTGFDFNKLCDPEDRIGASGLDVFNRQFFIANVDPSERYVLSLPGSDNYRLKTDQTGYDNLFFAGDWIQTGYNMGCAEVAVMSGLMAAQALRKNRFGIDVHKPIIKDLNNNPF